MENSTNKNSKKNKTTSINVEVDPAEEEKRRIEEINKRIECIISLKNEKSDLNETDFTDDDVKLAPLIIERMQGNLKDILLTLHNQTSPYEIEFAGLKLDAIDLANLFSILEYNRTLHTLNLSRKNLGTAHAKRIAEMLKHNKTLRRLELEGNNFGPQAAYYFADALANNTTLRYLDLENNILTDYGKDPEGVKKIFTTLRSDNRSLISLNLAGNDLTLECGQSIITCLWKNESLIHLDVTENQNFEKIENIDKDVTKFSSKGLTIQNLSNIKDRIDQNFKNYHKLKVEEWHERKFINSEDQDVRNFATVKTQQKLEKNIKQEDKHFIENMYKEQFDNEVKKMEDEFKNNVDAFLLQTKERLDKKNKKKKKKPKKK